MQSVNKERYICSPQRGKACIRNVNDPTPVGLQAYMVRYGVHFFKDLNITLPEKVHIRVCVVRSLPVEFRVQVILTAQYLRLRTLCVYLSSG